MPVWIWFVIAGICLVAELFSGTFYLLIIGIALGLAGLAGLLVTSFLIQLVIVLIASMVGLMIVRNSRLKSNKNKSFTDMDLTLDIGQKIVVDQWHKEGHSYFSEAKYRGANWQISYEGDVPAVPGTYQITGINGNVLQVKMID